jgi:hypothetical protein
MILCVNDEKMNFYYVKSKGDDKLVYIILFGLLFLLCATF